MIACTALCAVIAPALLLLNGCAGLAGSSGTPKLSDAMAAASDTSRTHTVHASNSNRISDEGRADSASIDFVSTLASLFVNSGPEHPTGPESGSSKARREASAAPDFTQRYWLTIGGGWTPAGGPDFAGGNHVELRFGAYTSERVRPAITGSIGWSPVLTTSQVAGSLEGNILSMTIGGQINLYTTPRHTALGQYFLAGLGFEHMSWSYRNPITYNGRRVDGDAVEGLKLNLGTGFNLLQTSGIQLGGEVAVGTTGYFPTSEEGFANDVFRPGLDLKCTIVASFGL